MAWLAQKPCSACRPNPPPTPSSPATGTFHVFPWCGTRLTGTGGRAIPRSAAAFTGFAGDEGKRGGAVLLCVANTPVPCTLEARDKQKVIQFTVLNVREKGWLKAPW